MATPTSVSIQICVDEGENDNNTNLFANGKAQMPVTVYVNIVGDAKIKEIGLLEAQTATDLYIFPDDSGFFTMPDKMTVEEVSSINDREYQAYPNLTDVPPPTGTWSNKQMFLVQCNDPSLNVDVSKRYELMGYVWLENYLSSPDGDPEDIVFYTCMNASNHAGQPFSQQNSITVDTFGKPKIEISYVKNDLESVGSNFSKWNDGGIYIYTGHYGSSQYTFVLKSCNITVSESRDNSYITGDPDTIEQFGLDGSKKDINKIAYTFAHQDSSGQITQRLADRSLWYRYDKGQGIASASCFFLKDSGIRNANAGMSHYWGSMDLDVEDVYGGHVRATYKADPDASNNGHARINYQSTQVLNL